jgi:hypothetical protein
MLATTNEDALRRRSGRIHWDSGQILVCALICLPPYELRIPWTSATVFRAKPCGTVLAESAPETPVFPMILGCGTRSGVRSAS